ncbi:ankyrin-2-like [Leptopilina heterotoma]|uniref:ankyrin-2-like n=1 Tax=Leptopilina heterotoma TaxID=63436 RepID=UPI001CA95A85|nr:ankyrin-2-like [Leptopilina heterotoma]
MDLDNDYIDTTDYNELFLAVHNGDLNLVQSLLMKHSSREIIRGRTLLHVATVRGHTEIAKLFTAKRDETGNTPLHLTIMGNQPQVFKLLLEESNVNARNLKNERPLHYAALYNRSEFAKKLIDNGAILEEKDSQGKTPLYAALTNGNVQVAEVLFKHGAVLSDDDLTNMTSLRHAVGKGNFEMVKLLMVNGCNKVDVPADNDSSLKLAVSSGRLDILEYLMKNGLKSSETINKDRLNLFETSIKNYHLNIFKYLVDIGVKTETVDDIFYEVINLKRYDMWEYLVKLLSTIYAKAHCKEKQLHFSVRAGQSEAVKAIVNEPTNEYESDLFAKKLAVYIAAETGNEEILENLLKAGYPVDSLFKVITPLHVAATLEHPGLVKLLLKAGGDINLQTDYGLTPLHFAAIAGKPSVVKYLLENGADPTIICNGKRSPLVMILDIFSSIFLRRPTSILTFKKLTKVTELLIRYSINETSDTGLNMLITTAAQIKVSSNNVEENNPNQGSSGQTPKNEADNSAFRPEILRCIFNYLSDKKIEHFSERLLNDHYLLERTPELLNLLMEYDDSKSCCDVKLSPNDKSYKSKLLVIHYSKTYADLLSVNLQDTSSDSDKGKTVLQLIVARLVLIIRNRHSCLLKFCRSNKLDMWRKKCVKERVRMRKTKVSNDLNITFYDALTKSADKLAEYASNRNFLKAIESSEEKFPAYAEFIKANVELAETRNKFINECFSFMSSLVKKCHKIRISKAEVNQIFKYLSIVDLRRFSAAFEVVEVAEKRKEFINECTTLMFSLVQKCHKIRISRADIGLIFQNKVTMSSIELQSLQTACFSGDESAARHILSQNNFDDYLASSSGYSLLCSILNNSIYSPQRRNELQAEYEVYEQLLANFLEISKLLLQHPVKVNDETQDHDQTPLHFAVEIGNVEIVKILLEKGAIVNATNNELNTPLHIAVSKGINPSESVIQLLLENGADLKICNEFGRTPYHEAYDDSIKLILSQHEIKMLFDNDKDIKEIDSSYYTALHRAVECRSCDLVEFLVSRGSDVNADAAYDGTPLHLASKIRHKEISILLLRAGADVNATDTYSDDTPLHLAAKYMSNEDDGEFLKFLINNGANLTAKNYYGLIPLNCATLRRSLIGATILLGENPNTCDMTLKMAFCLSFLGTYFETLPDLKISGDRSDKRNNKLICELFYNHGFRLNTEDIKNMLIPEKLSLVSLDHSRMMEQRNNVQNLLNKEETSCDEKMRQEFLEYHVLIGAIKYGFTDIFYNFLPNVCNLNTYLIDGYTLLHHACEGGRTTIVQELLARGAIVNVNGGRNRLSPLHVSVKYNCVEITKILLTKNANINSCTKRNETPLCIGVYMDSFECVKLLLEAGANVNCFASDQTLLFCAIALKVNINITKLLLHYGATCLPGEMEPIFDLLRSQSEYDKIFDLSCDHSVNLILDRNYSKCPNELEEMKKTKISETDVTMYDLLTMSHRRLSILMRNENFLDFINSFDFKTSFPNFARRFEVRLNKAKLEKRLIELSYDCFRIIVKFQLPILVLNEVISYIDTADLHRFVIASPIKSETKKAVHFHFSE